MALGTTGPINPSLSLYTLMHTLKHTHSDFLCLLFNTVKRPIHSQLN